MYIYIYANWHAAVPSISCHWDVLNFHKLLYLFFKQPKRTPSILGAPGWRPTPTPPMRLKHSGAPGVVSNSRSAKRGVKQNASDSTAFFLTELWTGALLEDGYCMYTEKHGEKKLKYPYFSIGATSWTFPFSNGNNQNGVGIGVDGFRKKHGRYTTEKLTNGQTPKMDVFFSSRKSPLQRSACRKNMNYW